MDALKRKYLSPSIEIIEVENEGVMALSNMPGEDGPFSISGASTRKMPERHNAGNSLSELEDLINDILTVEK